VRIVTSNNPTPRCSCYCGCACASSCSSVSLVPVKPVSTYARALGTPRLVTQSRPDILNTLLGVPAECVHQSGVWPCKLSFSCWLQGGKHAKGCGSNKWLFSCCVAETQHPHQQQHHSPSSPLANLVDYGKLKLNLNSLPKRIMLRRRDDNELLNPKVGLLCCGN